MVVIQNVMNHNNTLHDNNEITPTKLYSYSVIAIDDKLFVKLKKLIKFSKQGHVERITNAVKITWDNEQPSCLIKTTDILMKTDEFDEQMYTRTVFSYLSMCTKTIFFVL